MGKLEKSFYWFCFFLAIYTTIGFKIIPTILEEQLIKNLDEKLTQKTNLKKIEFNPSTLKAIIHDFKILDENNQTTISFEKPWCSNTLVTINQYIASPFFLCFNKVPPAPSVSSSG